MRRGAAIAAEAGADLIDINMGCPVRKVLKMGAGAALLRRPDLALALARAAAEGSGRPVTVKLRSGIDPGERSGVDLAVRLVEEGGVAAIALHPRSAAVQHKGAPDYALVRRARRAARRLGGQVIVSGGLATAPDARRAYRESGADAVMIARGALGNPWIFQELTGRRVAEPSDDEIVLELLWTMERAERAHGRAPRRALRCASSTPGTWNASASGERRRMPFSGRRPSRRRAYW